MVWRGGAAGATGRQRLLRADGRVEELGSVDGRAYAEGRPGADPGALADLDIAGVAFVSVPNNLDLSNPSGRLMFQVMVPWQSSNGH